MDQGWIQHIHPRHRRADLNSGLNAKVVGQAQIATMPKENAGG
jgi:hypothetical protein